MAAAVLDIHPSLTIDGLRVRRNEIIDVARRNKARNVRVVGSVARGEARPDSDLDLLIDVDDDASLWDLMGVMTDLEDLPGVKVEAGEAAPLKPAVRAKMLAEAVEL